MDTSDNPKLGDALFGRFKQHGYTCPHIGYPDFGSHVKSKER